MLITLCAGYLNPQCNLDSFLALKTEQYQTLETLKLSFGVLDQVRVEALGVALAQCINLRMLDLSHTPLEGNLLPAWVKVLEPCENLQTLSLAYIYLGDAQCFKTFCQTLAQRQNLKTLNLEIRNLRIAGAADLKVLGKAFTPFTNLQTFNLTLRALALDTACLKTLGEELAQCTGLQALRLGFNDQNPLTAARLKVLGELFAQCTSLQTLKLFLIDLRCSNVECFNAFYEALSLCATLTNIEDMENFSEAQEIQLREMLHLNKTLIENIQQTLTDSLPNTQGFSAVKPVIMQYMFPQYLLSKKNKTVAKISLPPEKTSSIIAPLL